MSIIPPKTPLEIQRLLIIDACFQQAFEDARLLMKAGNVDHSDLRVVGSHKKAFDERIASSQTKKATPVSFYPEVKRFMKANAPEWQLSKAPQFEEVLYYTPFSSELKIFIQIDKLHGFGLGKMFQLSVGICLAVDHNSDYKLFKENVFRLFGEHHDLPTWSYHTKSDLQECCTEAVILLRKVIPLFKDCVSRYLSPIPSALPNSIANNSSLTAREALRAALALEELQEVDLDVNYVSAFPRFPTPEIYSARLISGRLNTGGVWRIITRLKSDWQRQWIADIPYAGPIRSGWGRTQGFSPGIQDWIDSDQVAQMILERLNFDPQHLQLHGHDPAHWLSINGQQVVRIEATTGRFM